MLPVVKVGLSLNHLGEASYRITGHIAV